MQETFMNIANFHKNGGVDLQKCKKCFIQNSPPGRSLAESQVFVYSIMQIKAASSLR